MPQVPQWHDASEGRIGGKKREGKGRGEGGRGMKSGGKGEEGREERISVKEDRDFWVRPRILSQLHSIFSRKNGGGFGISSCHTRLFFGIKAAPLEGCV